MMEEAKKQAPKLYGLSFIASLVTAFVLSLFILYSGANSWFLGAETGFWAWLGFVATTIGVNGIFAGKRKKLMAIEAGYHLVVLVTMGIILVLLP